MTPLRKRFIQDMRIRNRSEKTISAYVRHAARFSQYFGRPPTELGHEQTRQYQLHLLEQKVSWSNYNQCVCALRFLYGTTLDRPEVVVRLPYGRRPKTLPVVLDRQEVLELFACVRHFKARMVLTTMYATGMRIDEAVHLGVADIDSRRMSILVARGKGNKQRLVPLTPALVGELRSWWQEHRNPVWLFPGKHPDRPVTPDTVQRACKKAVTRAGLKKAATPHSLRHTFATELLEADVDLLIIQKILGHTSLQTTVRYTHVRRNHLQKASQVLELLPLAELLADRPWRTGPRRPASAK